MHRRALLIDAMGTLVTLRDPVPVLVAALRERLDVEVTVAVARRALRAEIAFYHAHMQDGGAPAGVAALHRACAGVLTEALELPVDPDAMTEVLLASLRFDVFPDAPPALARARDAGARVIVVSNWDASLADVLERVGLADLLDGVVASAAVGSRKPEREIFTRALALAGAPAQGCVHVGDSLTEDVAGARAAGIEAILLDRRDETAPPAGVSVIHGLDDLILSRR